MSDPATGRRWFRFSLRTLIVAVACVALALRLWPQGDYGRIQGRWRSEGDNGRFTLTFQQDTLVGQVGENPIVDRTISTFSLNPDKGEIDIQRDTGLQLGLYHLQGSTLTLSLAPIGKPRPLDFRPSRRRAQKFVFKQER